MLKTQEDKEDLMSSINAIFTKLVYEYDMRRGVDFPYYIKRMLEFRTYHYVTKQLRVKNKEVTAQIEYDGFTSQDYSQEDELNVILNLNSWDDNFTLGKKQKRLFIGLVVEHKSLKELAEEEGVDVAVLHTRMHFLLKKLRQQRELQRELEEK
jgi:DNA-directed RNA polymerase specialized sigma24 family protein